MLQFSLTSIRTAAAKLASLAVSKLASKPRLRLGLSIGALLLAAIACGFWPWPVSQAAVQSLAAGNSLIAGTSGSADRLRLTSARSAHFVILPSPRLTARAVTLESQDGDARLSIQQMSVRFRLLPLLTGSFHADRITINDAEASGRDFDSSSAIPLAARFAAALKSPVQAQAAPAIRVAGSRVVIAAGAERLTLAAFDWRPGATGKAFELTAAGQWKGETFSLAASGPMPEALPGLPNGGAAALKFNSPVINAAFTGSVIGADNPRFRGAFSADAARPRAAADWFGTGLALPEHMSRLALQGEWDGTLRDATLPRALVSYGNAALDGALAFRLDEGRPRLTGSFAMEKADIGGLLAIFAPRRQADFSWSHESLDRAALACCDLDLRLSGRALTAGPVPIERAAVSVLLRNSRLEINIAEAVLGGGASKGRLTVVPVQIGLDIKAQGQIERTDAAIFLGRGFGLNRLTGLGSLQFNIEANGASTAEIAETLSGRVAGSISGGQLIGIDLDRMLLRLERRSALAALDTPAGLTSFQTATVTAAIQRGLIENIDISVTSPTLAVAMTGSGDVLRRVLRLNGTLATHEGRDGKRTALPFSIHGLWDAPQVTPLIEKLQRRS